MITVAIQAGGSSTRMGRDKALITLAGISLIEHVLHRIEDLGDETLIATKRPDAFTHLGIRTVSDALPDSGTLVGLHSALAAAKGETVLVLACDMPFLSRPLLAYQLRLACEADIVVPFQRNQFEPLHAVYDKQVCLPALEAALHAGERRLTSFYSRVRVLPVEKDTIARLDPSGLSFFNINTPQDLVRAEQLLADETANRQQNVHTSSGP